MKLGKAAVVGAASALGFAFAAPPARAQSYRVERIASGLNQPTFVTQAPGDPANVLYYIERTVSPNATFGANSAMGKLSRYDVNTRTSTTVLDLSTRSLTQDGGLLGVAFHPDFNTVGSAGFGKFYTSTAQSGGTNAVNRVEEWSLGGGGGGGPATLSRTILQYNNASTSNNHTVDWIGFNPAATGAARTYLHISTGDGSAGLPTKPSQNLGDPKGKILRVDVAGSDAYPSDPNKNFAIPGTNPLVAAGMVDAGRLGEVYASGLRNAWRASFDRGTGDLYLGDVGEGTYEEVNVLKAGTNLSGNPVDFGWPQREGTGTGPNAGPSTGSLNPIRQRTHAQGDFSVTGGYLYRGPIAELAGKYIYGDFVAQRLYTLDFNRDTDPASFDGNRGTFTDVTALFNSLVMDPTDPNYTAAQAGQLFGVDRLVSFGEDNAGNLYVVDFGYGTNDFGGQYPPAGRGEIFRLTPVPEPAAGCLLLSTSLLLLRRPRRRGATGEDREAAGRGGRG